MSPSPDPTEAARTTTAWPRLLLGLIGGYVVLQWTAQTLGSSRGEAGLVVGALVVLTCLAAERLLFGRPFARAARELGLGRPAARGMVAALGVALALLLVFPAYAAATGARLELYPGWAWLLPGLFAQAGISFRILQAEDLGAGTRPFHHSGSDQDHRGAGSARRYVPADLDGCVRCGALAAFLVPRAMDDK